MLSQHEYRRNRCLSEFAFHMGCRQANGILKLAGK